MKTLILSAAFALSCLTPAFAHNGVAHHGDAHSGGSHDAPVSGLETRIGDLQITGAFARATLPSAPVGGAYFTLTNHGTQPERLLGLSTDLAERVEIHEMLETDGVMRMRPLQGALEIAPGASVSLAPGGLHLMLMGLKRQLIEGESLVLNLQFETAGRHDVPFAIAAMNARGAAKADAPCHMEAAPAEGAAPAKAPADDHSANAGHGG